MYKLSNAENIIINTQDGSSFDITSGHPFALEYQQWRDGWIESLEDGQSINHLPNTPLPADEPVVEVITKVTMRQARLALSQMDLLQTINSAINSMTEVAQIEWEYASRIERNNPLFIQLAVTLNFTEQQIDDFFTTANGL